MAEYMLDTDISSYIMKRSRYAVLRRLRKVPIGVVCISVITKAELLFGVEVSPRRQQDRAALDEYLRHVEVLDFPDEAARHYAQIRAALKACKLRATYRSCHVYGDSRDHRWSSICDPTPAPAFSGIV
jgi:tRNA(fMet)-specific endonuclease VapC